MRTTKLSKVLILLLPVAVLSVTISGCVDPMSGGGCGGSGAQGWSGFVSYNDILYLGSMEGEVLALDPSTRSQNIDFPREGEWRYSIKASGPSGSMCGPACASSAAGIKIYSTPVIAEDLVYVGTYNGKIYALNATTGALRWVYPREGYDSIGPVVGSLVAVEDTIYIGSSNGKVYALDAATGDWKWEFDTEGKIWTSPVVSDEVVYVGNHNGSFYALSRQDGSLLWVIELSAAIASSPIVSGGKVFFGTFDRYLYAISEADGRERWRFEGGNWFWASVITKGSVIYAGCLDHNIYALDSGTGKELWRYVTDGPIVSTPVLVDDRIVVVSELGTMYIIEADNGFLKHTVSIGYSVMAPLYSEGNIVYIHARDHYVYAVDIQSGEVVWKFNSVVE